MSQAELGKQLGVDRKTVGLWERTGNVPITHYVGVERVLDLDLSTEITQTAEHRFSVRIPNDRTNPLARLRELRREMTVLRGELDDIIEQLELQQRQQRNNHSDATAPRPLQ